MNTKTLIAAVSIALLGNAAFASDTQLLAGPSTASRAEVKAELQAARAAGQTNFGEAYSAVAAPQKASGLSRAQVVAELNRARQAGELDNMGESYGYQTAPTQFAASGLSRAEVQAAARAPVAQP